MALEDTVPTETRSEGDAIAPTEPGTEGVEPLAESYLPIEVIDWRLKVALLVVSVATIAILAAAALRENVFTEWRQLRTQYREVLVQKATDERGKIVARNFAIQLVQDYVPALGVVDRCVTCHVGVQDPRMINQAQPFTTHPGRYLQIHDPEKFGCTECHQGQGRATETAAAHGRVPFWDYPMLDPMLVRSTCTKCHIEADLFGPTGLIAKADGQNETAGADLLARGRRLVREYGCLGCHTMGGKGGSAGPDLSTVGSLTHHHFSFAHLGKNEPREVTTWLRQHFRDPAAVSPGSIMPAVDDPRDAEALTAYVLSRREREVGRYFYAKRLREGVGEESGRDLYARYCSACHGLDGTGGRVESIRTPSLNDAAVLGLATDDFYRRIIESGRSGTHMPAWGEGHGNLSPAEIDRIIAFLRSWEPPGPRLADISARRGDATRGKQQFEHACASCHGMNGEGGIGPALRSAAFLAAADDRAIATAIINGKPGTAMPGSRDLTAQDVSDLLAFLYAWKAAAPTSAEARAPHAIDMSERAVSSGKAKFAHYCSPCHGPNGRGEADGAAYFAPALNNPEFLAAADNGFLLATITRGRPGTQMIPFGEGAGGGASLKGSEIEEIVAFIRSWQKTEAAHGAESRAPKGS